jgi:hypothetical protein
VVVITDQQDFGGNDRKDHLFNSWRLANNPLAHIYSVDIGGYNSSVLNNNDPFISAYSGFDSNVILHITSNRTDLVEIIKETISEEFEVVEQQLPTKNHPVQKARRQELKRG